MCGLLVSGVVCWCQVWSVGVRCGVLVSGVFVVGPGQQGVLLEHREREFGDLVNTSAIVAAVRSMAPS
ncbi:hypothetical protein ACOMHN_010882 [Nucella lapillus]